jgi:hypothetical protein
MLITSSGHFARRGPSEPASAICLVCAIPRPTRYRFAAICLKKVNSTKNGAAATGPARSIPPTAGMGDYAQGRTAKQVSSQRGERTRPKMCIESKDVPAAAGDRRPSMRIAASSLPTCYAAMYQRHRWQEPRTIGDITHLCQLRRSRSGREILCRYTGTIPGERPALVAAVAGCSRSAPAAADRRMHPHQG